MKFKVGDRVTVRKDLEEGKTYYMEGDNYIHNTAVFDMMCLRGKIVKISNIFGGQYEIFESDYLFTDGMFEDVAENDNKKVVITTDNKTVTAKLYADGKEIKTATAKCNPEDKFDFLTGAKLAFDRLIPQEKAEEAECGFKVGDAVKVIDKGRTYSTYFDNKSIKPINYISKYAPQNGEIVKVISIDKHCLCDNIIVVLCRTEDNQHDFLIGLDGIEKCEKPMFKPHLDYAGRNRGNIGKWKRWFWENHKMP